MSAGRESLPPTRLRDRSRQIGALLGRSVWRRLRLGLRAVVATREHRAALRAQAHLETAEQVARTLGQMKGVFMKLGQILSFAVEGLPPEARAALASLQKDAPPMDFALARGVLERELGGDLGARFRHVDEEPIAAASIGQVHRARLRDGTDVVLKIQYPGVDEAIRADLRASSGLAMLIRSVNRSIDAEAIVAELRGVIESELDYRRELANQALFARLWQGHPLIRIPRVFPEHSRERVLCQAYHRGLGFTDFLAVANAAEKRLAIHVLHDFVFDSMNRFCVFNGDPHPGNYLFHEDGGVSFLDFGCVKQFRPEFIRDCQRMNRALCEGDRVTFAAQARNLGFVLPGRSLDADQLWGLFCYLGAPFVEDAEFAFSAEWLGRASEVMSPTGTWGLNLPRDFVFMNRITFGLNAIFHQLGARENFHRMTRRYFYPEEKAPPALARLGLALPERFLSVEMAPATLAPAWVAEAPEGAA